MSKLNRIGLIVDAQNDFMYPEGRLYVKDRTKENDPGAEAIIGTIYDVHEWMKRHCQSIVFTADWHSFDDPEIDRINPDFKTTFPPHCMGEEFDNPFYSVGADLISVLPDMFAGEAIGPDESPDILDREISPYSHVYTLLKTKFNVFEGNAVARKFFEWLLQPGSEVFVAGVARDVCVTQAVEGLVARGYDVKVITDATHGLGIEPEEITLNRWDKMGVTLVTSNELGRYEH